MTKLKILSLGLIFITTIGGSVPAQALVKFGSTTGKSEIKGVVLSATAQADEKAEALKRVTQGLRQKKVILAWFSVYVAQFFTNHPVDFKSIESLKESLLKGLPVIVSMTFVRDVDNKKITDGFKEVFQENGVDVETVPFKDYLEAIKKTGDIKDRQVFTFIFNQKAGKESFRVETQGKEIYALNDQAPGVLSKFFNMWLAKPVDSGLKQLQEQILKP